MVTTALFRNSLSSVQQLQASSNFSAPPQLNEASSERRLQRRPGRRHHGYLLCSADAAPFISDSIMYDNPVKLRRTCLNGVITAFPSVAMRHPCALMQGCRISAVPRYVILGGLEGDSMRLMALLSRVAPGIKHRGCALRCKRRSGQFKSSSSSKLKCASIVYINTQHNRKHCKKYAECT